MAPRDQVRELRSQLAATATPERAAREKRYLKSDLQFLGADVPATRAVTKRWLLAHPDLDREGLLGIVTALWTTRTHELRSVAVFLLDHRSDLLEAGDADQLIEWVRDARTWAHVDWLAAHALGQLVTRHASVRRRLPAWSRDPDFWVRRAALLALLEPLRRGEGDFALFARMAVPLLGDREFFIRKAIGWVLRTTAAKRPDLVREFVAEHASKMSGLTLREATRKLDVSAPRSSPARSSPPMASARKARAPRRRAATQAGTARASARESDRRR